MPVEGGVLNGGHHCRQAAHFRNGHPIAPSGMAFTEHGLVDTTRFNYDAADQQFAEEQREIGRREVLLDQMRLLSASIDIIVRDENPVLACDCFIYATGQTAKSEVEIAAKHGVTKAAVSKRAKKWQHLLDLPPLGAMRTEKACRTFKTAQEKAWKTTRQS